MPGWKIQPTKKVDLPDDVADGLWMTIHHPKLMPFDAMNRLMALAPAVGKDDVAGFDLDSGRDLATAMIVDWNLPGEDGKILPIPSKDEDVWNKVPLMPIIQVVFEALGEGIVSSQPDPNSSDGSANS